MLDWLIEDIDLQGADQEDQAQHHAGGRQGARHEDPQAAQDEDELGLPTVPHASIRTWK